MGKSRKTRAEIKGNVSPTPCSVGDTKRGRDRIHEENRQADLRGACYTPPKSGWPKYFDRIIRDIIFKLKVDEPDKMILAAEESWKNEIRPMMAAEFRAEEAIAFADHFKYIIPEKAKAALDYAVFEHPSCSHRVAARIKELKLSAGPVSEQSIPKFGSLRHRGIARPGDSWNPEIEVCAKRRMATARAAYRKTVVRYVKWKISHKESLNGAN